MVRPDQGLKINLQPFSLSLGLPKKPCLLPSAYTYPGSCHCPQKSPFTPVSVLLSPPQPTPRPPQYLLILTWMFQALGKHHLSWGSCQVGDFILLTQAAGNSCLSKLILLPSSVLLHPAEVTERQAVSREPWKERRREKHFEVYPFCLIPV